MNATTVLLEGSRATSGGARVEVDLSHLTTDYSLFPGQIVAVEGHNTSGRKLVAQRLCEGVALPPLESTAGDLFRFHHEQQDGSPLRIVTAAGPFTTADNLDYQPLLDFLSLLQADAPDVVILTGPFVDLNHGAVQAGQMTVAFENDEQVTVPAEVFFCHKIAGVLEDFYAADHVHTQFILQPSVEDATAEWVYVCGANKRMLLVGQALIPHVVFLVCFLLI
jgi:DNA polymerase alpha subunit B